MRHEAFVPMCQTAEGSDADTYLLPNLKDRSAMSSLYWNSLACTWGRREGGGRTNGA